MSKEVLHTLSKEILDASIAVHRDGTYPAIAVNLYFFND
jgi:hypothetical protein